MPKLRNLREICEEILKVEKDILKTNNKMLEGLNDWKEQDKHYHERTEKILKGEKIMPRKKEKKKKQQKKKESFGGKKVQTKKIRRKKRKN